jgi:hypothetical protein
MGRAISTMGEKKEYIQCNGFVLNTIQTPIGQMEE